FYAVDGIRSMREAAWASSAFWMYTVLVNEAKFGIGSRELMQELANQNIQTRPLWQPLHLSAAHKNAYSTDCSVGEKLNRDALSLPCSVGLAAEAQQSVIECVASISRKARQSFV